MKRLFIAACFVASMICAPIFTEQIAYAAPVEYIQVTAPAEVLPAPTIIKTIDTFAGRSSDVTSYTLNDGATSNDDIAPAFYLRC